MDVSAPVLVLFCKEPRLGYGKQRLAATVGEARAQSIARALLDCALEDAAVWEGPVVIAVAAPDELPWARALLTGPLFSASDVRVESQCDGNLGERLAGMDSRLRARGAERIVFMGSDAPTLTDAHFASVRLGLNSNDVVLADGEDGGVTLMASRCRWPPLRDLPWSTAELGDALAQACRASGRSVLRIDGGIDLDDENDMTLIGPQLEDDLRSSRRALMAVLAARGDDGCGS